MVAFLSYSFLFLQCKLLQSKYYIFIGHLLYFCIFRNDCRNTPRRHMWYILYIRFSNESSVIVANRLLFNLIKISLYGKCNRDLLENQLSGNVTVLLCAKHTIGLHHHSGMPEFPEFSIWQPRQPPAWLHPFIYK